LLAGLAWLAMFAPAHLARAMELQILSLAGNGVLTFTNSSQNATCRVEWASSPQGPWHATWEPLTNLIATGGVAQVQVPMFYRVVATLPPSLVQVPAPDWMAMLVAHARDTNCVILDIRTPAEYAQQHIQRAVNIDYYAASFSAELAKLDRNRLYLLYCGSGSRSGKAMPVFSQLGFQQVYGMTGGFSAFRQLAGASAFLTP